MPSISVLLFFIEPRVRKFRNEPRPPVALGSSPVLSALIKLLHPNPPIDWCGRLETRRPVALGSSPELSTFTMSLAPPVHPSPIFLTDTENL